ncbi:MAG: VCBS repeat-containing protein, partial [Planctomycetota bacterium]|nr:VCBS repeat-containing protein [Planctomycetota bacterium]
MRFSPAALALVFALGSCSGGDGGSANDAAGGGAWFEEVAAERGLVFVHETGHDGKYYLPEIVSGGAALVDVDGDGDLDAYLVQGGGVLVPPEERPGNVLLLNDGTGHFEDVSAGSGADDRGYGMGVACGDPDRDGDVDLYVTNVGPNVLLENDGLGRFTDATEKAGVGHPGFGSSAAFFDSDHDGDQDLFVVNYLRWSPAAELTCRNATSVPDYCAPMTYDAPARDVLYRNEGGGAFVDATVAAGIDRGFGNGLGVVCGDFDGDGLVDVFVANDAMPDQLWINQGAGRFADEAFYAGCAVDQDGRAKAGMGVTAADLDDDGDLDLLVCNLTEETNSLFRNEGGHFRDATNIAGLGFATFPFTGFGLAWVDFDHDGRLDLYQANGRVNLQPREWGKDPYAEPNLLFRGTAGGRFEEVQPRGGVGAELVHTSRAAAFGDVDGDGAIDVLVVNRDAPAYLLRNAVADRGHGIIFRVLDERGSDALGATLTLKAGERTITRDVRSAYSYLASNDPR